MSLIGFATLSYLRQQLLPEQVENETTWDDDLTRIGRGVAGQFDAYCGRKFARATSDTYACDGGVASIQVPRYPLEQVTTLEREPESGEANEDISDAITTLSKAAGIIKLRRIMGSYRERIHVTYDGGYWIPDGIESQPSGSTQLPHELLDAWVLQCQAEAEHVDLFGVAAMKPSADGARVDQLPKLPLVERVRGILDQYRRLG